MPNGLRAAVCGTSTSSTLPSMASSFEKIATRSAIAQLGIQGIAERVAEQTEAENGERDRKTRKDGDPWRRRGVFLGAALQHQAPCRRRLLHAEPKIGQRRLRQDRLADEGGQHDQKRRQHVRHHVAKYNARVAEAAGARSIEIRELTDRKRARAHDPRATGDEW